ncbi:extracellular solute-binding protein [Fictibacillus phosphorivorans]|uniref:extracellular solute-binding protein n=1 Tax=Fictibacillus phosphorivorans TaxID=1221500 RepID=UPI00203A83BF|nr:extracellular solute-binding protein [Fictibacillus phosphorivorans]MCM3720209.1 extracellular solute-binding protein [Fictibacillus phosphorivorans]MCM3777904.1 extracellular solute-binding protein [Fictibacillus phosphorivorans]
MKFKRFLLVGLMLCFIFPQHIVNAETNSNDKPAEQVVEENYHTVLENWKKEGKKDASEFEASVSPSNFQTAEQSNLLPVEKSKGYNDRVFYWHNQASVSYEVDVKEAGLYELSFDYYPLSNEVVPIEGAIQVNGKYPFYESRRIVFPADWKNAKQTFQKDRFGNDMIPKQKRIEEWSRITAEDASQLQAEPLKYELKKGKNTITLSNLSGEMFLGKAYVKSPKKLPTYKDYLKEHKDQKLVDDALIIREAEKDYKKNSSYIRPFAANDTSAVPSSPKKLLLNTLGGDSWKESGQTVNWKVNVKKDGFYKLTFKVLQNKETTGPVFRKLLIDGEMPFAEAAPFTFDFNKSWSNVTLSDKKGKAYLFYLTKGEHDIGLEADASPVEPVLHTTNNIMREMEELTLEIRKLTGNQTDTARGWKISEYIPGIDKKLAGWADELESELKHLRTLDNTDEDSKDMISLKMAIQKLRKLSKEPDEIPARLTELSEGSSSAAQLLGNMLVTLPKQPLTIDRFYVHGDEKEVPNAEAGFWEKLFDSIQRFFLSFFSENYSASEADEDTLEVWVNRPRQYVELLQNLSDQTFTPESGIKVKFSIMPEEQKLILANASNKQPDLALGISSWLPYELSIRGAAVDLHQFDDFETFSKQFSPGAFLPLMIGDSVYAMPETQDFFVQFYRKDILQALGLPVPDTWEDVKGILPELQRYGMNYYTHIAGATGFKPFQATAPFVYQFDGDLYGKNGMKTAIGTEESLKGIKFMAELNTVYSLPLQVPNFYNHFRYSTLPIGTANFTTYTQLTAAAPEIAGWWDISPHPGVKKEDGTVERWATGSGQSAMIFKGTKSKEDSWELLKWWLSTDTQTEFATNLQMLYGPEYMWNTSNLEAFKNLPWPEEHKETILKQWEYLYEVPKNPGSYMIERELSNIWNRIVFDGVNPRSAVDDSVVAIDREIKRKMEEFGYVEDGKMVKPYPIPTIEQVKSWAGDENEDKNN